VRHGTAPATQTPASSGLLIIIWDNETHLSLTSCWSLFVYIKVPTIKTISWIVNTKMAHWLNHLRMQSDAKVKEAFGQSAACCASTLLSCSKTRLQFQMVQTRMMIVHFLYTVLYEHTHTHTHTRAQNSSQDITYILKAVDIKNTIFWKVHCAFLLEAEQHRMCSVGHGTTLIPMNQLQHHPRKTTIRHLLSQARYHEAWCQPYRAHSRHTTDKLPSLKHWP
jgi:hypothetical protein